MFEAFHAAAIDIGACEASIGDRLPGCGGRPGWIAACVAGRRVGCHVTLPGRRPMTALSSDAIATTTTLGQNTTSVGGIRYFIQ